ncbi:signal peptidase II [uncultured Bacteroides sp.]|uniref:signal peptidase II n=1 Tax=uncultured Bacteroides sp. TaxID=162156 RepID=UPI00374A13F6
MRLFIVIIISSGFGNLISHFYYPYRVIDFIDIKGSYELLRIGVFNFADFALDFGICGLLITLIVIAIRRIINYATKVYSSAS